MFSFHSVKVTDEEDIAISSIKSLNDGASLTDLENLRQQVFESFNMSRSHYKVYAGVNMSEQAHLYHSKTLDILIEKARERPINLEKENGEVETVSFGDVFDLMAENSITAYVYGGAIRDAFMNGIKFDKDSATIT